MKYFLYLCSFFLILGNSFDFFDYQVFDWLFYYSRLDEGFYRNCGGTLHDITMILQLWFAILTTYALAIFTKLIIYFYQHHFSFKNLVLDIITYWKRQRRKIIISFICILTFFIFSDFPSYYISHYQLFYTDDIFSNIPGYPIGYYGFVLTLLHSTTAMLLPFAILRFLVFLNYSKTDYIDVQKIKFINT